MAAIGLKMVYVGVKNPDGTVNIDEKDGLLKNGIYAVDTDKSKENLGTKSANITGLSGTPTKIPGNNEVVDVSNPPSAPTVAWDANLINFEVKQKILGRVADGIGGYIDGDGTVEAGMIIESQSPITYKSMFYCFGRGTFTETGQNIQTNTDTAETREDDILSFTALGYDGFNGKPFSVFYEGSSDFDKAKMFEKVFPGQTLITDNSNGDTGTGSSTSK